MAHELLLTTFRDAIYHCLRWAGHLPRDDEMVRARAAVLAAYKNLFYSHNWRYYMDDRRVILNDDFTDGTISYDHSGASSERLVTWTASDESALPTWTRYGKLKFSGDDVLYKVQERLSDTTFTLTSSHNPGTDVASSTFNLIRTEYPLTDVHRIHQIEDEDGNWQTRYVTPDEWLYRERQWWTSGPPFYWTIMGASDLYATMSLRVTGYPAARRSMDFIATRKPRRLLLDGIQSQWNTGTVSSASGTTVVISGNTFANEVVGAVIRLSRDSNIPTDIEEGNPYIDQRVITAAATSTLTVDDTIDTDGVSVSTGYCVSDPVDIAEYLKDVFDHWCEYEYARRAVPERLAEAAALLKEARREAQSRDKFVERPLVRHPWSHPAFALAAATVTSAIPAAYFT